MKKVKVIIEWASDGGVWALIEGDGFTGRGDTVEAAVNELKEGVAFFIETAKEMNFPYKDYLACIIHKSSNFFHFFRIGENFC